MYFVKTPRLLKRLMPEYTWDIPTKEKVLYLTFDDGPIPEITPWVLDTLAVYQAKATFFCVGDNVRKYPDILARLLAEGHRVGNHTFNHINGWNTHPVQYLNNVRQCSQLVHSPLFRPPYGRVKTAQRKVLGRYFQLVMWDVLSADFDRSISPEQCRDNIIRYARPGSIIVLHDSLKAEPNLRPVLPEILAYYSGLGYRFEVVPDRVEGM